jgi:hypothetical protein
MRLSNAFLSLTGHLHSGRTISDELKLIILTFRGRKPAEQYFLSVPFVSLEEDRRSGGVN